MGKTRNEDKEYARVRRPQAKALGTAEWREIDGGKLIRAISIAASHGGALRFGYTRDGGAYAIGVYGLGEYYTAYLRPRDDVGEFLDELADAFADLGKPADAGGAGETQLKLPGMP